MTLARAALLSATAAFVAGGAALALMLNTANAASDVRVTAIDCLLHPRKIAIQNAGDTAQDLTGWKLLSNKPNEEFDLGVVGSIAPGDVFYVYNGHGSEPAPYESGGSWIYPWNYTPVLDESFFVLTPDGTDFIRLVDATGFPWREVSNMRCPDNTTDIPPLEQPATPTPTPSGGNPGGDTNQPQPTPTAPPSGGNPGGPGSQSVPAANTTAGGRSGPAAQTGNVSDQALGGPSSGVGVLSPASGGSPFAVHPFALGIVGVFAGAALALVGVMLTRRALRRP